MDASADLQKPLIEIAIESWRFSRLFLRLLERLDAGESARFSNQCRYYQKRLEENFNLAGMRLVNIEGQPFDPGIAATAMNLEDFAPEDSLLVEQMLEPIIMGPEGLIRSGVVMLKRAPQ